jgi:hypothetical protein
MQKGFQAPAPLQPDGRAIGKLHFVSGLDSFYWFIGIGAS